MSPNTNDTTHARAIGVTVRHLGAQDADTVRRLAERDSARLPGGELLGAEVDGRLVAAISASTGEVIADPFQRTSEVLDVLRLRVAQLQVRRPGRARRLLFSLRGRRRSGAGVAPVPPGAGGHLITLAQRSGR
jgi:hypothetical protein